MKDDKEDLASAAKALADMGSEVITEILSLGLPAKRAREKESIKGSHFHQIALPDPLWSFIQK